MTGPRVRPRRLAIVKPDFGVRGGFERVLDRIEATLRADGHDVARLTVDVNALRHRGIGPRVSDRAWAAAPEYFRYLASIQAFRRLDTRGFDAVVSTQPPSFAAAHPRHLAVFYHHHRIFYDLEDTYVAAGFAPDPEVHRRAGEHVRRMDQPILAEVRWFLAGSERVRSRLARFNGLDQVGLFHAGVGVGDGPLPVDVDPPARRRGPLLCVSRHEFPKRTELVVHALKHLPDQRAALVGTGGRLAWARAVDHRLSTEPGLVQAITAAELWCNTGLGAPAVPSTWTSNVEFLGRVDDGDLESLYRTAPAVVAPALDEDYGLTALEAMRYGAPVIVCEDGGGLTSLVEHEVDGLVVAPTGPAIAEAVTWLRDDPDMAAELAANGRAKAQRMSWAHADDELRRGLATVLA